MTTMDDVHWYLIFPAFYVFNSAFWPDKVSHEKSKYLLLTVKGPVILRFIYIARDLNNVYYT